MNVWIVSRDVWFVTQLKEEIKASKWGKYFGKKLNLECFYEINSCLEFYKKNFKDLNKHPHLVFFDSYQLTDLEEYQTLLLQHHELSQKIYFCSAMSFGLFETFFKKNKLSPPPFVQKNQVTKSLDLIIQKYLPENSEKKLNVLEKPKISSPLLGSTLKKLEEFFKKLRDDYYAGHFLGINKKENLEFLDQIKNHAKKIKNPLLDGAVDHLKEILSSTQAIGIMRLRKEIKGFLDLLEKVIEGG